MLPDSFIGLAGSVLIAGAAYAKRSLSLSGAAAAVIVGTLMYALGSLAWFGTLIAFFVSSTLLTKWKQKVKAEAERSYAKTGRRDAGQVFANGGAGALLCILHAVWPSPFWWWAFLGVMASVNADTWATEVGGLSKSVPRSIRTWKKVPSGTSGGITAAGVAASVAGGLFIGATGWLLLSIEGIRPEGGVRLLLICAVAGLIGSLADSWIGAAWQTMYRCEACGREVERKEHCGKPTVRSRGVSWMGNDAVNVISSLVGGSAAVLFSFLPGLQ
jgi:uncharacterized protein (TIGR00297 family)